MEGRNKGGAGAESGRWREAWEERVEGGGRGGIDHSGTRKQTADVSRVRGEVEGLEERPCWEGGMKGEPPRPGQGGGC